MRRCNDASRLWHVLTGSFDSLIKPLGKHLEIALYVSVDVSEVTAGCKAVNRCSISMGGTKNKNSEQPSEQEQEALPWGLVAGCW